MKNLVFVFVVAFVFSTTAMAADIAISTQAGWFGQAAADREMQEIVDNVTAVTVEQFTADQQDALADWVVAHTGDGVSDILILCGQFPDSIYPGGNAQPDDSLAELFLDDGNTIVNTGDYMFYVNNAGSNNADAGLQNMMDIAGITMWDDNTPVVVTAEGHAIAPSLQDLQSDRPFHLDQLEGDWYAELILAQNDAGTRADPVIVANSATGGRLGIFYQTSGQDDDPRGEVISEVINWFLSGADIPKSSAWRPNPADGAIEVEEASLDWAAGNGAVSHKVYLSADEIIDESDLAAETDLTIHLAALDPGMTYYWRVDEVDADGAVIEGQVWSFSTLALEAHFPSPADGAEGVESGTTLSWMAGKGVIMHDVYFGTDEALVAAGDPSTFKGKIMVTSFDPGPLELFTTYYWRIDEFSVTGTHAGPVWSFDSPGYIIIEDNETAVDYDNTAEPFVSETAWDTPADLTKGGVSDLTLRFQGKAPSGVSLDEATGTYTITGGGHDIWDDADDFHFAYRELNGDATMVARVVDNGSGTNEWAKGGVMIRQSIDAGSTHRFMPITGGGGNGASFQGRPVADGGSNNSDSGEVVAPPYWVKLERVGNDFTGSISPDGVTWTQLGGIETIEMTDPVLIGLAVTSHQTGELRTFTFDNVDIVGDISVDTASMDIGDDPGGNAPAPIYVAIEDTAGAAAMVYHGNPAATNIESWRQWKIPLAKFVGVDVTSAAKLYIGVGDGEPGGTGSITVDDIFVVWPTGDDGPSDITVPGDIVKGAPDDGDWPGAETPDLAIDDNTGTKYLHFKGETEPTGFKVTPLDGPSVVTGLTFTTANDASPRDPISFELSGSNGDIDGPYTLIARGDIVDFAQEAEWPRFTMNETEISFDNTVVYSHYQIMFPAVRDAANANSMQIAEVELIGVPADTPSDVSAAGDLVQGVPNDGDWPGAETPDLAVDDNVGTKYLHFKGETEPTGFQIEPASGPSVVTGLTFTTANDAAERDPISFELSGSNVSIDGPYDLIAIGDIVDFAQEAAWPRFTMNSSAIMFENAVAYKYYQVMFPTVRDAANANSMQIAEVELIGLPAGALKINFQQTGGEVPSGYLPDGGEVFDDRGNGFSYGWNMDSTGGARNRNSAGAADERYDTLNHLEKGEHRIWEIELPNGRYDVFMVSGDPDNTDQINNMDVEGTVLIDPDGEDNFDEYSLTVEVTDGLLTIQMAEGASNAKIMFVDITIAAPAAEIVFAEDFESYAAGTDLQDVGGWAGWAGDAGASAPVSDAYALSGSNSVEAIGSADLVQEFDIAGGMLEFSAMQYIPSGTTGTTYFILMNQYGAANDWSVQTSFNLESGAIGFWHGGEATILYDQWVELKYIIDLDNNTVDKYYNGELIATDQWDDNDHGTLGAIDLFGNNASSVYYDDITIARP